MIFTLNKKSYLFTAFLLLIIFNVTLFGQNKKIYAVRVNTPPVLDGIISDSVWQLAKPISNFREQDPIAGQKPSYKTVVRILYDNNNLYVSFMCYDPHPDRIIARALEPDGALGGDDNVRILFDTFHDKRNGYWFATNPLGMRDDALLGNGGHIQESWNGVWEVKSAIVDSGWSTEMRFPFSTFKFYDKPIQIWGINFQREIKRDGEMDQWSAIGNDKGFFKINFAGELLGIKNISRGNPIYLKPYLTVGSERSDTSSSNIHKPGLDIKYGLAQALSLDLTFNTDFSQVESDRAQINLTRFPLFFPEKRDFFLEGAGVFDFSFGGHNNLFYSRRIGIYDDNEVPIIAGAKLVGRTDNMEIGVINMQTRNEDFLPTTNYGVARVKFDVLDQSYIGGFVSNLVNRDNYNRSLGLDGVYTTNNVFGDQTLSIGANIAKTDEKHGAKNSWAGRFYVNFPNDLIRQFLSYRFIQGNFNPGIGFVSRTGIQSLSYNFEVSPRVEWGAVNRLNFSLINSNFEYDGHGNLLAANMSFEPLRISTIQGDRLYFRVNRTFDFVQEEYTIFDSTDIPAGKYWYTRYRTGLHTGRGRALQVDFNYSTGNYYTGNRNSYGSSINWSINKHLNIFSDYSYNRISLSNGNFTTNEVGTRLKYDFSTKINSSIFAQWNNEQNLVNINYRIKWEPKVGSDLYLVINHLLSTEGTLQTKDIAILAKVVWLFII